MTCNEFQEILDKMEKGAAMPAGAMEHAGECARCALSLRLADVLFSAPRWAPRERMSVERRAVVLARARRASLVTTGLVDAVYESLLNAMVALALLCAGTIFLPPYLKHLLPPSIFEKLAGFLAPLGAIIGPVTSPLLASSAGTTLLLAACFTFCFCAAFSARMVARERYAS